jgi:hypothetical protein
VSLLEKLEFCGPDDMPDRSGPSMLGGFARYFKPGETITVTLPMPPTPCRLCGADLRGRKVRGVEPHEDGDGGTAWFIACAGGCS